MAPNPSTPASLPVTAEQVRSVRAGLAACLDQATGLGDEGLVESIRALEELVCTATAAQAALSTELDASLRASAAEAGVKTSEQGRGIGHVVACARRESPSRGMRHVQLAAIMATELPHTWRAWRAGRITEWMATIIARETACVSLEHRLLIDKAVCGGLDAVEVMGIGQLTGQVKSLAEELDPAAAVKRRRNAEAERRVSLRPAPDTMTWLTALLPVKDGVAVLAALAAAADSARTTGDERTRGQVMADTLVDRIIGGSASTISGGDDGDDGDDGTHRQGRGVAPRVNLNLVMSDKALFGGVDTPAHLHGFGPIPAELAREIVREAMDAGERVWLKRLYADPETDELIQTDSHARLFPPSMARFVQLRDQVCRTPWCDAPIRHIDHVEDHADGGPTSLANAQGLCEACNQAKNAHRWKARPGPEGQAVTIHPVGPGHTTGPPGWTAAIDNSLSA